MVSETRALWLAGRYLGDVDAGTGWVAATNAFIADYGDRQLPLCWYTHDRLRSREARASWVEPDRRPLAWPAHFRISNAV